MKQEHNAWVYAAIWVKARGCFIQNASTWVKMQLRKWTEYRRLHRKGETESSEPRLQRHACRKADCAGGHVGPGLCARSHKPPRATQHTKWLEVKETAGNPTVSKFPGQMEALCRKRWRFQLKTTGPLHKRELKGGFILKPLHRKGLMNMMLGLDSRWVRWWSGRIRLIMIIWSVEVGIGSTAGKSSSIRTCKRVVIASFLRLGT